MSETVKPNCPFCESDRVIKHGKTLPGTLDFDAEAAKKPG